MFLFVIPSLSDANLISPVKKSSHFIPSGASFHIVPVSNRHEAHYGITDYRYLVLILVIPSDNVAYSHPICARLTKYCHHWRKNILYRLQNKLQRFCDTNLLYRFRKYSKKLLNKQFRESSEISRPSMHFPQLRNRQLRHRLHRINHGVRGVWEVDVWRFQMEHLVLKWPQDEFPFHYDVSPLLCI